MGTREKVCNTSRGGTLSTGYLLRLAKFAQEKCGGDNSSSSQVQHFPSIREKRKEDCLEDTAPSFLALGMEKKRLRWLKNRFFEKSRDWKCMF